MTCVSAIVMSSWVIQDQDNKASELLQQHWVGGGCYMIPLKLNAEPPQTGKEAPSRPVVDFSVCEIRHLISRLLLRVEIALEHIFAWSFWRRMHQAVAKACHWKGCGLC